MGGDVGADGGGEDAQPAYKHGPVFKLQVKSSIHAATRHVSHSYGSSGSVSKKRMELVSKRYHCQKC